MDFAEAVTQHLAWKKRLRRILLGRERRKRPERTAATDCRECPLEQWIRVHAETFSQEPLFRVVEEQHRLTHDLAVGMVLEDGLGRTPLETLFRTGEIQIGSKQLLEALEGLRRKYGLSGTPLCAIPPDYVREAFPPVPDVPA